MLHRALPLFALALALPSPSPAANGTGIDAQENLFGATNINAITGHGGLTAGISRAGDLTVLTWPGPSYSDQLGYRTLNALDARDLPLFGAPDGAGLFLGLRCELTGGDSEVAWLRDADAFSLGAQDYGPDDGANPHTRFRSDALGLDVLLVDAVAPDSDTLVRRVTVTRDSDSPVESCWLLTYANLTPQPPESRLPELPVVDWLKDGDSDFVAVWDASNQAVLHLHPGDQRIYAELLDLIAPPPVDWGPVGDALTQDTVSPEELTALATGLDDVYNGGAWLALTTVPRPDQHQVGFDATPFCDHLQEMRANVEAFPEVFPGFDPPLDSTTMGLLGCTKTLAQIADAEGWVYPAEDALADAADGELSGASLAAGEVNEALRTLLEFSDGTATAAVVLGAGATLADARAALSSGTNPADVQAAAADALDAWLDGLTVPGAAGSRVHTVARRSLINIHVGTDRRTGATVASLARQPPYGLDWPRDGAFFNVLLDAAGQTGLVEQRLDLYAGWQRDDPVAPTDLVDPDPPVDPDTGLATEYPADAWEMDYYADGLVGGIFRFEIDTTAFAVWTLVAHAGWAADPQAHLRRHWETIVRGCTLLVRWRDAETGLPAPAQEDDSTAYSQTLHGAITVFGALDLAARAARLLGEDAAAAGWEARAAELRTAMETHFYDAEDEVFEMGESSRLPILASGLVPVGPTAWLVWPCSLYPFADPHIARQLTRDYGIIEPVLNLETPGGLYYMKNTISLALAGGDELAGVIAGLPELLADEATVGTNHFGEVMVVDDSSGTRRPAQRVSTPHLWEGALFYLTALAAENPAALLRYDAVLPASRVLGGQVAPGLGDADADGDTDGDTDGDADSDGDADGDSDTNGGCGCGASSPLLPSSTVLLLLTLCLVARRRQ